MIRLVPPLVLLVALAPATALAAEKAAHSSVGPVLFGLAALVVVAKAGGLLSERRGQPSVLGELPPLAGGQGIASVQPEPALKVLAEIGLAVGMIPRGEVGLIFAGIGASLTVGGPPLLSQGLFSALALMVLVTTLVTPIGLRSIFARHGSGRG